MSPQRARIADVRQPSNPVAISANSSSNCFGATNISLRPDRENEADGREYRQGINLRPDLAVVVHPMRDVVLE
jgi:hypothetical protein